MAGRLLAGGNFELRGCARWPTFCGGNAAARPRMGTDQMSRIKRMLIAGLLAAVIAGSLGVALLAYQGRQRPDTSAEYVALGSSFAAGLGLGPRVPGSPIVCQRSVNGYPQQLARMTGLSLSDMSCSGATASPAMFFSSAPLKR